MAGYPEGSPEAMVAEIGKNGPNAGDAQGSLGVFTKEMAEEVQLKLKEAQDKGDMDEMERILHDAKARGSDNDKIDAALAELARARRDLDSAAELCSKAEQWKKQGNDKLKDNTKAKVKDAIECYTAGIKLECASGTLNSQLYGNRAHARMLLRNFVEAIDDCRKAIQYDPSNVKAYFRAAKASVQIELFKNAVEFCNGGLKLEPDNSDLQKIKEQSIEKLEVQQKKRSTPSQFNADEAMELQDKVNNLNQQLAMVENNLGNKTRERQKTNLCLGVLTETPQEVRTFRSCGRCFILQDRDTCEKEMQKTIEQADEEIPKLNTAKEELVRRRDDAERELRDMIQAYKRQAS